MKTNSPFFDIYLWVVRLLYSHTRFAPPGPRVTHYVRNRFTLWTQSRARSARHHGSQWDPHMVQAESQSSSYLAILLSSYPRRPTACGTPHVVYHMLWDDTTCGAPHEVYHMLWDGTTCGIPYMMYAYTQIIIYMNI